MTTRTTKNAGGSKGAAESPPAELLYTMFCIGWDAALQTRKLRSAHSRRQAAWREYLDRQTASAKSS